MEKLNIKEMKAQDLRIGNLIYSNLTKENFNVRPEDIVNIYMDNSTTEPIPLTEEWLLEFGFTPIKTDMYINGKQWLMQVTDDYVDEEACDVINRDGTWFDGIGTHSFIKNGAMAVNVLCRGNYVCNSVSTVHQLQNLYYALTQTELT